MNLKNAISFQIKPFDDEFDYNPNKKELDNLFEEYQKKNDLKIIKRIKSEINIRSIRIEVINPKGNNNQFRYYDIIPDNTLININKSVFINDKLQFEIIYSISAKNKRMACYFGKIVI